MGPLLFLLYINDFSNFATTLDFHLFTDDSNLFYSNRNLEVLERNLNEQLLEVHEWLCANKHLMVKSQTLFSSAQCKKHTNRILSLKICDQQITERQSINYLGILMDCHLN